MVPDYYARLGVDPEASQAEIEAALKQRQPAWSMGTRNPKTRHTNQQYLDEVPALRRALLGTADARAAYDAELMAAQIAEREAKLDELQRRIRLRAAKGGLNAADHALLKAEAARLGVSDEILDRLTRLIPALSPPVRAEKESPAEAPPAPDILDASTRRQIRAALEHLDRRDLYDAIGVSRDAPISIIAERADEERQRWMKKAQVTAEKTAWLELISHAQSHLTSPRARVRYDQTLAAEAEEKLEAVISFALQEMTRLDLGTRAAIIEEAAAMGVGSDRADQLIGRIGQPLGIAHESGSIPPLAASGSPAASPGSVSPVAAPNGKYQQIRCRNCSGVTELSPVARRSGAARCRHCGASLKWECPVCHRSHWIDEPRCDCGLLLAVRDPLVHHFAAAQHAFRAFDLTRAREHLERVQKYAPHHVGARNGMARIQQQQAEIDRMKFEFQQAVTGKKLVAARQALEAWRRLTDPSLPEIRDAWKPLTVSLRQAQEYAARARRLERTDPPAARSLYRRALEIAVDLPEAVEGLTRCPPDPPSALDVQLVSDRIRLSWTPPAPDGLGPLTFAILRKRGGLPQHPADGTRIAEISTNEYEDRHVKPGEMVSYAVLSKRGDRESLAAVAGGPVAFLPDVQEIRVEPREGRIELSWVPPHGVFEIRVVRKQGSPPENPRDGDRVPASLDQALDSGLREHLAYHYGVFAIYRTADGLRYPSKGVVVSAFPQAPVAPLAAPRVVLSPGRQVRLDWIEPPRGQVRILRTNHRLPHQPGSRIDQAEADHLGGEWLITSGPDRAEDSNPPTAGISYYTPMVALGGTYTVGEPAVVSRVVDPTDLRANRLGGPSSNGASTIRVQVQWRWAEGAMTTRLAARLGSPPAGPADPEAILVNVSREEYDRQGAWILNLPKAGLFESSDFEVPAVDPSNPPPPAPPAHWQIRAYSIADLDGAPLASPGLEPTAVTVVPGPNPQVTVSYTLKRSWFPGRPWMLTTATDPPGSAVPPLVVVANDRAVPLSADDGTVIAHLPAGTDGAAHAIRTNQPLGRANLRAFVDPTIAPDSLPPVRFRHPETGTTRA